MSKCPKCKAKISYLNEYSESRYIFELGGDGEPTSQHDAYIDDSESYECPVCNEELFEGLHKAVSFLKGDENGNDKN